MKIGVIFWSGTGNTEQMAQAIAQGAQAAGAEVDILSVADVTAEAASAYERLALGCPAMGAEVLEEGEFEPFYTELEGKLRGKQVALFGSYGWGDGQWMRDWQERAQQAGISIVGREGLMVHESPDAGALDACRDLGKALAS